MSGNGPSIELFDYSGGRNSSDPEMLVPPHQAIDCQNINLLDRGFMKRLGNTALNSSAMISSVTAISGMGYVKYTSALEYLNAIAGAKFFTNQGIGSTMTDSTGALTITAGQDLIWTPVTYNDLQIWFGGAPDAPFKYASGGASGAALGGTPPSAKTAFVANNRVFAIQTAAAPDIIQWPIVSNPEDWTGSGSGNSRVSKNDGEALLFGVPIDTDVAILFKNSSTHLMVLTKQPFPVYQLQRGVGAAGTWSWVNANGTIFFITPQRRMKATRDGRTFQDFPNDMNDVWDNVNTTRIGMIYGQFFPTLYQIHWFVSTGSSTTNNACIIWDIQRNAWLYNPTGFKANVACLVQNRRLFTGHYTGKLYEQNKTATYTDASETSPGLIDAYWRYPWLKGKTLSGVIHPLWLDFGFKTETTGTVDLAYGFDFTGDQITQSVSIQAAGGVWDTAIWDTDVWGGQTSTIQRIYVAGRGNVFNMRVRHNGSGGGFTYQGATLTLRGDKARKLLSAT